MYIALLGNKIAAAMILNSKSAEGYEKINWGIAAEKNEVTIIHALGVMPDFTGKGFAKEMVREAIRISLSENKKALRLDVLSGNIPALRLYESLDFSLMGRIKLFYEDTGKCDFDLFEYVL